MKKAYTYDAIKSVIPRLAPKTGARTWGTRRESVEFIEVGAAANHLGAGQKKEMLRERIAMVGILRLGLPARKRTSMPRSGGQGTEMTRYREDKVRR